jgi:hypothetical protein
MRFRSLLIFTGVLALIFGLGFFFAPVQAMNLYGASTGPVGYLMTRFFGAALFQVGLVYLMMRGIQEPGPVRGVAIGSTFGSLAGLRVALYAQRNGLVNAVGWSTVAIYAILFVAFGWFALGRQKAT